MLIFLNLEKSGLTNSLVRATIPGGESGKRVVLVRTFGLGSEQFIDRSREVEVKISRKDVED